MNIQKNTIIPKKCRVGFQRKLDVEGEKIHLSFITYYLDGKLRKEKSFNGWRNKNIDPIDIENKPTNGFKILETPGERYITDAKYARILDPRGFIFEINISNLLSIINDTDIINSVIQSKCVFAYNAGNLILVPVKSKYYNDIINYTSARINNKITKKDMIVGNTYLTKNGDELIFIGNKKILTEGLEYKKGNIYININKKQVIQRSGYTTFIKNLGPYKNFKTLIKNFNNSIYCDKIKDIELLKVNYDLELTKNTNNFYFTKDLITVRFSYTSSFFMTKKELYAVTSIMLKTDKDGDKFLFYEPTQYNKVKTKDIYYLLINFNKDKYNYNDMREVFNKTRDNIFKNI